MPGHDVMSGHDVIIRRTMLSGIRFAGASAMVSLALLGAAPVFAQSTDQQIQQMEKKLDMNAMPDTAALGFQNDLTKLQICQSGCKPLIDAMLKKYSSGPKFGGNAKLGDSDSVQLAGALATAAATLPKAQASAVGDEVTKLLGSAAGTAFSQAYASTTAPYNPQ